MCPTGNFTLGHRRPPVDTSGPAAVLLVGDHGGAALSPVIFASSGEYKCWNGKTLDSSTETKMRIKSWQSGSYKNICRTDLEKRKLWRFLWRKSKLSLFEVIMVANKLKKIEVCQAQVSQTTYPLVPWTATSRLLPSSLTSGPSTCSFICLEHSSLSLLAGKSLLFCLIKTGRGERSNGVSRETKRQQVPSQTRAYPLWRRSSVSREQPHKVVPIPSRLLSGQQSQDTNTPSMKKEPLLTKEHRKDGLVSNH